MGSVLEDGYTPYHRTLTPKETEMFERLEQSGIERKLKKAGVTLLNVQENVNSLTVTTTIPTDDRVHDRVAHTMGQLGEMLKKEGVFCELDATIPRCACSEWHVSLKCSKERSVR